MQQCRGESSMRIPSRSAKQEEKVFALLVCQLAAAFFGSAPVDSADLDLGYQRGVFAVVFTSSASSPVAIRITSTALPITSAGRFRL
jgi:hypothetical protein